MTPKVTLELREEDARAILNEMPFDPTRLIGSVKVAVRALVDEIQHALAECDCGDAR